MWHRKKSRNFVYSWFHYQHLLHWGINKERCISHINLAPAMSKNSIIYVDSVRNITVTFPKRFKNSVYRLIAKYFWIFQDNFVFFLFLLGHGQLILVLYHACNSAWHISRQKSVCLNRSVCSRSKVYQVWRNLFIYLFFFTFFNVDHTNNNLLLYIKIFTHISTWCYKSIF